MPSSRSPVSARRRPPRSRPRACRRLVLAGRRIGRSLRRLRRRLMLLTGWTWVAAGSLVGFEVLELLLGGFLYAPELLPLLILAFALVWYFRERIRAVAERWRWRLRLAWFSYRATHGRLP